ncbi:death-on-curing protein [Alkalibacterium olivapovliticus]|uniref:Death-on-curing protein n=2 Tax=Alkalibacterium olivapovliticus TaxID=99907 RepID=A0A2T0VWH5_9LACT|nr:death-on-curing protein [Alkalibacterium olivapovliticus]
MMRYLTAEDIIKVNVYVIKTFSPKEPIGVKDANALKMVVAQPEQVVFDKELYPTVFEKAAILVINLTKRHPFYNGNKRTAWVAMDLFLKMNGYQTVFPTDAGVEFILSMTTSNEPFEELKKFTVDYLNSSGYVTKL